MSTSLHVWHHCDSCGQAPLEGTRWHCTTCPAGPHNDLCERCHAGLRLGHVVHPSADRRTGGGPQEPHVFRAFTGATRAAVEGWLAGDLPTEPDPPAGHGFVVRPEFRSDRGSYFGGHAFVVNSPRAGEGPLVLTALHVLDELIKAAGIDATGKNLHYTGTELPALVRQVVLYDVFAENWMVAECGTAAPMQVLPDARVDEPEPDSHRDVAAFALRTGTLQPRPLASRAPAVGEPVWLAFRSPSAELPRPWPAVTVESTATTLVYRFQNATVAPQYSSGAPLLNRKGEVVGINAGAGVLNGCRLGHASTVTALRRHLDQRPSSP